MYWVLPNRREERGLLRSIPKGDRPFFAIHADHYGPLEKSKKDNKYVLVIVDGFTK